MNERPVPGRVIETIFGNKWTIVEHNGKDSIGEGGQGTVYKVEHNGEIKALKWYKRSGLGNNPDLFYENIKNNVLKRSPSEEFLWPLEITDWVEEGDGKTFGYIMDLRPEGYYEISDFMLKHVQFKSFRTVCDAAMHIVTAFRILHGRGYSYQDMNDGNFFINPDNGKVLICDNDNVAPDKTEAGILGKPRYMAPEIVMGQEKPSTATDLYSMSVILFILFTNMHPLEGKRSLVPLLTPKLQERLYGSEACFLMDPEDDCNRPDPNIHKYILQIWSEFPQFLKDIFFRAFSKDEGLFNRNKRPKEIDWLEVLTRLRSSIVRCSCSEELFSTDAEPITCIKCGRKIAFPYKIRFNDYKLPGIPGTRFYRVQFRGAKPDEAMEAVGSVVGSKNNSEKIGLRNMEENTVWDATTPSGRRKTVPYHEVVPLKEGIRINIHGDEIEIEED